ncbi:MAG: hypothetical protein OXI17_06825 [Gammaproteobacteria bacterium]|nr:hypothetical protein [Gammaproteobacteria bacterium]
MLFSGVSAEAAEKDRITLYGLLTGFCAHFPDHEFRFDDNLINGVVFSMRTGFPHKDGFDDASPFKKAAQFVCQWIAAAPISTTSTSPCQHINAVFALLVAAQSLHHAKLSNSGDAPKNTQLSEPIALSRHSFWDIVDALSTTNPAVGFKLVSVLLEQLAYKTNPECQYEVIPINGMASPP